MIYLLADEIGTLWIATWGGGLNRLTGASLLFDSLTGEPIPQEMRDDDDVTCLMHDSRGGIWIGTRSGFLFRREPDGTSYRRFLAGGTGGTPRILLGLYEDHDGHVWVGSNAGVLRLDPQTGETAEWVHDPLERGSIGPGYVKAILEDRDGKIWVGTGEGGLLRIDHDGRVLDRFVEDPRDVGSLSDNYVTALLEDSRATLWVGTRSGGLNAVDPSSGDIVRYLPIRSAGTPSATTASPRCSRIRGAACGSGRRAAG